MASGCEYATQWLGARASRWRTRAGWNPAWAVPILLYGVKFAQLAAVHPYASAYLNAIARAAIPGPAEDWFEPEYWGHPYREGSRWVDENTKREAEIWLPVEVNAEVARHYLELDTVVGIEQRLFDPSRPRYAMFITRRALYPVGLGRVRRRCPLAHAIRVQGATLFEIYANRGVRSAGGQARDRPQPALPTPLYRGRASPNDAKSCGPPRGAAIA